MKQSLFVSMVPARHQMPLVPLVLLLAFSSSFNSIVTGYPLLTAEDNLPESIYPGSNEDALDLLDPEENELEDGK